MGTGSKFAVECRMREMYSTVSLEPRLGRQRTGLVRTSCQGKWEKGERVAELR
jgi:hypothetical protein